jgi:hypothetical protein
MRNYPGQRPGTPVALVIANQRLLLEMGGKQAWPTVNVVFRVATAKAAPEKFRATVNSTAVSVVPTRKLPAVAELRMRSSRV